MLKADQWLSEIAADVKLPWTDEGYCPFSPDDFDAEDIAYMCAVANAVPVLLKRIEALRKPLTERLIKHRAILDQPECPCKACDEASNLLAADQRMAEGK